ncbi:short-subunit dehydrogenase [Paraperlucidibaca baekdonensis]|uniref:Short-subunit dehydrogenase n=1 Tax=Paraperlucidibaca baekdonensis TaxID=748120 RepID=A0A3E0H8G9_9GAMM|nr:SDR family oxidoreductase [Paraperlucidibaca baekdonensis]REH39873.1 short-subunit dehydrogenase [Paraperlucidibaca baekdonensis]
MILISGCSSGIGKALALALHARGAAVCATARRLNTIDDLAQQGLMTLALDVNDSASIAAAMDTLDARGVHLSMLVNNAGYGLMGPLADISAANLQQQFQTNVLGLLALTQAVIPRLAARRSGLIVNIGSVSGVLTTPFAGAYCATKAAVHALSDALRMELAPLGIRVMTVQPGAIASAFGDTASNTVQISDNSLFAPLAEAIAKRANASQQRATPARVFAEQLASAMLATKPPSLLRIGTGSRALPWVARWLPRPLRDGLLSKLFSLSKLKQ